MPGSLFLKIFLWFVAVVLTVIACTYLVGEMMRPERPPMQSRRLLDVSAGVYAQAAAESYEREGPNGLLSYLQQKERDANARLFLFNHELEELSGRRFPGEARAVAQTTFDSQLPEFVPTEHGALLARSTTTSSGAQYVLIAQVHPPPPEPLYHPIFHIIGVALIAAAFCYWLARYLTSPVAKLRAATRELAKGNLSARVGPGMGSRRDELVALGKDFDEMAEQIEALINSQRRLLGDISHELRSPLARLNVALELARQRSGADAASALERIQREAENLNEMIGQLLALTRLESGAEELKKSGFDLARLVREVGDDAHFEARSRDRSVRLESPESCEFSGVEHLLRRAIENVVRNAVQHTKPGSEVQMRLECNPKTEGVEQTASITVRDHGAGVPDEVLEKIFQPFYRVDEARDRESGGAGLGLAIADRAVRLHQGTVKARNADEGGLIVTITLPLSRNNLAADYRAPTRI